MNNSKIYLTLFFLLVFLGMTAQTVMKIPFHQPLAFKVSPGIVHTTLPEGGSTKLGLDASVSGGSGVYTYSWTLGDVQLSTEATLTVDKTGNYSLLISDGNGCQSSIMYFVTGGSAIDQIKDLATIVYPNPTEGPVYIHLKTMENLNKIEIITPDGRVITEYSGDHIKYENNKIFLNLKNLPKGNYFISLYFGKKVETNAIILR